MQTALLLVIMFTVFFILNFIFLTKDNKSFSTNDLAFLIFPEESHSWYVTNK
jgi:hypothetical protein